ncbi:unnamed protein product [Parnassius mnemosyne]|uniref:Uncharacterized protein n=1 Tax=Parnassius mnemosyne TaxID=213953 RepID=A0AAV1LJC4_9NEOP
MPKGVTSVPIPEKSGPVLAFYAAGEQACLKAADDIMAELKKSVRSSEINIQEQWAQSEDLIQFGVLPHLNNSHCVACYVEKYGLYLISAYFKYSDSIDQHLQHLETVLDQLKGKRVVIGVDCNAHSPL